jgi:phage FluMu protein Com
MNIEKVGGGLKCDNPKCDWINETIPDEEFENWLNKPCPKCGENVLTDEDFKFAKALDSSIDFINQFYQRTKIPLDPIYTGKMMYAIYDLIEKGFFKKKEKILVIHTGGLQGIEGFNERFGNLITVN